MRSSFALSAASALLLLGASTATAKQGLLRKPVAVAAPRGALPSGVTPAMPPATAPSPGAPVAAIVVVPLEPGAIDPGVEIKPMPLPSIDLPPGVDGSVPVAIHHPWQGGAFVPGAVGAIGEGASEGAVGVAILPGAPLPEGLPMIGFVESSASGDVALTAAAAPPAWGPGGKHGHPHHGSSFAAGAQAAARVAAADAPADGVRAPAGGWPGRAAGLRGEGIGPGPSRGPAAGTAAARPRGDATGPASAARGAAGGKADSARSEVGNVNRARSEAGMGGAGVPASAAAAAPRWRDRLRFAWPLPR